MKSRRDVAAVVMGVLGTVLFVMTVIAYVADVKRPFSEPLLLSQNLLVGGIVGGVLLILLGCAVWAWKFGDARPEDGEPLALTTEDRWVS